MSEYKVNLAAALVLGPVATTLVTSPFDMYVEAGVKAWRATNKTKRRLLEKKARELDVATGGNWR